MNMRVYAVLVLGACLLALAVSAKDTEEAAPADEHKEEEKEVKEKSVSEAEETPATEPESPKEESTAKAKDVTEEPNDAAADESKGEEKKSDVADKKDEDEEEESEDTLPFACNLKFKRVGCYADKGNKDRPLRSFIMSDADMGTTSKKGKLPEGDKFNMELPKFACKCANEAIGSGNAVFGLQNLAECWSGPDDSKYDRDGESEDCVTFDYAPCEENAELCAGKKHANFVYYVDTPEHTKSKAMIKKEYAEYKKKVAAWRKKQALKKKAAKKDKKKAKKGKKQ